MTTTEFIRASIHEVVKTLLETIVMVFLILYFFLQNLADRIHSHDRCAGERCSARLRS